MDLIWPGLGFGRPGRRVEMGRTLIVAAAAGGEEEQKDKQEQEAGRQGREGADVDG